jgi:hypothetical protein
VSLTVTADLIRELVAHAERSQRAEQTGIVLGADGWDTAVRPDGLPDGLTAISAEDVYAYADGEVDDDIAKVLIESEGGTAYTIPSEDGDLDAPADGIRWAVVTGHRDSEGEDIPSWQGAYWFDTAAARKLIDADREDIGKGRSWELWRTAAGAFLLHIHSVWAGDPGESWVAIDDVEAAKLGYGADETLVGDDLPLAVRAARLAAELVDLLAAPSQATIRGDGHDARREAIEAVRAAGAAGTVLRDLALADIRAHRARAARAVMATLDGDLPRAAAAIGIHKSTLSNLLKG